MAHFCRLALLGLAAVGVRAQQAEQQLEMGSLRSAFVNEDSFQYYSILIPSKSNAIKVKLIPSYGDPDVYLSFTAPEPDDLTATWVMDDVGAEEQVIKRDAVEFCQSEPCILHISVYGYDESEYMIGVYDASTAGVIESECSPGCKQDMIADGVCQQVRPSTVPPRPPQARAPRRARAPLRRAQLEAAVRPRMAARGMRTARLPAVSVVATAPRRPSATHALPHNATSAERLLASSTSEGKGRRANLTDQWHGAASDEWQPSRSRAPHPPHRTAGVQDVGVLRRRRRLRQAELRARLRRGLGGRRVL